MIFDIVHSDNLIKLALILPLVASFLSFKVSDKNYRDFSTVLIGLILLYTVHGIYTQMIVRGGEVSYKFAEFIPEIPIYFNIDALGLIFAFIASFLWIITTIYAVGYMRCNEEENQNRFFGFFAFSIFATLGIAFAGNLLTLFIFYEVLTLSTYPLVTHSGTKEARESGRKYLGILLGTSICLQLPAIIITYYLSGTLDFTDTPMLNESIKPVYIGLLMIMYIWGVGKAAVMPFHKWLPAAMVAPTPVSALLHAVAVVKAGLFTILKIVVYVFGVDNLQEYLLLNSPSVNWAAYLAGFTIITASIIALKQDNLKLRLAYSTISQLSYVVLAATLFNHKAIITGVFHIVAHAFSKITLFFAAGSIYTASKKKYISELKGIGKRMPITCLCFAVGAISMIGLPPTAGLITKFYLIQGEYERDSALILVLVVSTILNAMYFLPIISAMFFEKENKKAQGKYEDHGEAPKPILFAISVTAVGTILLFFNADKIIALAKLFVEGVN